MPASLRKAEKDALEAIARKSPDKKLHPQHVVKAAASENHPLHKKFEWDNTKAGHAYRVWQARELIAVYVTTLPGVVGETRAFVSIRNGTDGYMPVERVMESPEVMARLVAEMKSGLLAVLARFSYLRSSAPEVFRAVEKVAGTDGSAQARNQPDRRRPARQAGIGSASRGVAAQR